VYKVPGTGGVVGGGVGLAATGADVTWWVAFGIVSVLVGLFLLRMSTRRDAVAADSAGDGRT
jgi:LPXTG-motif cell wall-anchored protein